MDDWRCGGFFFLLYMLLVLDSSLGICVIRDEISAHPERGQEQERARPCVGDGVEFIQQEVLLRKLEELVRNLSEIVSRLEAKFVESLSEDQNSVRDGSTNQQMTEKDEILRDKEEEQGFELVGLEGERKGAVSVKKYSSFWSERFHLVSAVKLQSIPLCVNVLPFRDDGGLAKYVAIGDDLGRIHVVSRNGDVLLEFNTCTSSPITAMASYFSSHKNKSMLVTGHHNGMILIHQAYEIKNGDDSSSFYVEKGSKFSNPENAEDRAPISILQVHHVGRSRYLLSCDSVGNVLVFKEDGRFHGSAMPMSKPLAFLRQRLLFLTERGAGSLDLKSMKIRESECEGLNQSIAHSYVFDATERSKAYGLTSDGYLIHVLILGDMMNFKCRVRSKRRVDAGQPLTLQAIKGYLLLVNKQRVFFYNVSTPHYVRVGAPRLLFSSELSEIRSLFLSSPDLDEFVDVNSIPLVASDREKLVVLGLGNGYLGMYKSDLPLPKAESGSILWTSPVLFFVLFLFGTWQLFARKKEALTSCGPDDPFNSPASTTGPRVPLRLDPADMDDASPPAPPLMAASTPSDLTDPSSQYPKLTRRVPSMEDRPPADFPKRRVDLFLNDRHLPVHARR